jgi:hypothetical protein
MQVNHQILDVIMSLGEVSLTFGNECERLSNQATLQTTGFPPASTNAPCGMDLLWHNHVFLQISRDMNNHLTCEMKACTHEQYKLKDAY